MCANKASTFDKELMYTHMAYVASLTMVSQLTSLSSTQKDSFARTTLPPASPPAPALPAWATNEY